MARSEQQFIDLCKEQIERKFSFGNGHGYTQRDLEVLSARIEEKTQINISLSTLKRLWKNDYKQSPQLATLNALAMVLDYKDWHDFKQANPEPARSPRPSPKWIIPAVLLLVVLGLTFGFESENSASKKTAYKPPRITGTVTFETTQTVTSGIPNTVIFNYDVSNVIADSFFIQQSWNDLQRVAIDPKGKATTSIYYESGFHTARLLANDSVIATQPIHILSNGWEPHLYYSSEDAQPVSFKNDKFIANGQLHLDSSLLAKHHIDYSKGFFTRISNSQVFDVHSDNFTLSARLKVDSVLNNLCPWVALILVTDVDMFRISLNKKGCEKYVNYKLGDVVKMGDNNDLSNLGRDIYHWQDLTLQVKEKQAAIYLNDSLTYKETFKGDFGKIVGLAFVFDGTGSLDQVELSNEKGEIVFKDDFERYHHAQSDL